MESVSDLSCMSSEWGFGVKVGFCHLSPPLLQSEADMDAERFSDLSAWAERAEANK